MTFGVNMEGCLSESEWANDTVEQSVIRIRSSAHMTILLSTRKPLLPI